MIQIFYNNVLRGTLQIKVRARTKCSARTNRVYRRTNETTGILINAQQRATNCNEIDLIAPHLRGRTFVQRLDLLKPSRRALITRNRVSVTRTRITTRIYIKLGFRVMKL